MRTPLSFSLAYARQQVLKDRIRTKQSLNTAQTAVCKALGTVIREFTTKFPDPSRPELELQPNDSMRPHHFLYAITVLGRKQDTDSLLHFLANEKESNLHLTIEGQSFSERIHLFDAPTKSSRPLREHLGMVAPQPSRLHFRMHAPAHLMSADEAARQVLRHFEAFDPVATLIFDRDGGVRTLRSIEFSIIPAVLSDADFGVCEVSSSNARWPGPAGHPLRRQI